MSLTSTLPRRLGAPDVARATTQSAVEALPREVRRWCTLAVGSLVGAGLLSLAVVLGRLPGLSRLIDDPLFFKRCLVVHVDLALVVWFYAFIAGLLALGTRTAPSRVPALSFALAGGGVLAMLAGAGVRGAAPVLANYVPVIAHPLFGAGLGAFFAGVLLAFVHRLADPSARATDELPVSTRLGCSAAALLGVVAAVTWVSARAGLPAGLDVQTQAEFLAWGPGHVLQAANACAMLAVWLWLLCEATGSPALGHRGSLLLFAALVLPQTAMPLLTARGTMDTLYHTGATQLMRWSIFPAMVTLLVIGLRHLRRHPVQPAAGGLATVARRGFLASAGLALLGLVLGACIRGSNTLVPAHYHASLGAVTVSFMTAAYLVCHRARQARHDLLAPATWRRAYRQLALFGLGQTVFVLGFALGGAHGLGRKTYAAEQHVRTFGEIAGLAIMGIGGLVAVAGGLWFLALVLREVCTWWQPAPAPAPARNALIP